MSADQLTLFVEASPVRTCPLPESGRVWLENGQAFGMSSIELLVNLGQSGYLSKMSPVFYPAIEGGILPSSFAGWSNSGMACVGGYLTLSTSEWPNAAAVCSLSQVLETDVQPKYYLSAKAAAGILRRAERRGKELPETLRQVLEQTALGVAGWGIAEDKIW